MMKKAVIWRSAGILVIITASLVILYNIKSSSSFDSKPPFSTIATSEIQDRIYFSNNNPGVATRRIQPNGKTLLSDLEFNAVSKDINSRLNQAINAKLAARKVLSDRPTIGAIKVEPIDESLVIQLNSEITELSAQTSDENSKLLENLTAKIEQNKMPSVIQVSLDGDGYASYSITRLKDKNVSIKISDGGYCNFEPDSKGELIRISSDFNKSFEKLYGAYLPPMISDFIYSTLTVNP